MKRSIISMTAVAVAVTFAAAGSVNAQAAATPAPAATPAAEASGKYVGVGKCKLCHKKPEVGAQYDIWLKSGHAQAFATLATDKAKAEAAKQGIADPQKDAKCLKCHATAAAVMADLATQKITLEEGVSCESCHGAGSGYYKKKTMEDLTAGKVDAKSVGFMKATKETCVQCHTKEGNTFYKDFVFEERVKAIAHPRPKKPAAG